jgi:hypothetical protein
MFLEKNAILRFILTLKTTEIKKTLKHLNENEKMKRNINYFIFL